MIRKIVVFLLLVLGGFLVETHKTLDYCSLGIAFCAIALALSVKLIKEVPGIKIFTETRLKIVQEKKEWAPTWLFLIGLAVLAGIGVSSYCVENNRWFFLFISMLVIGGFFFILESHSSVFWQDAKDKKINPWYEKYFVPEVLILSLGSFFLFTHFTHKLLPYFYSEGGDSDYFHLLTTYFTIIGDTQYSTPYITIWAPGFCAWPCFLEGQFLRIFGITLLNDILFISILNLIGLIFFYKFLCFYTSKKSALISTLLLATSHWALFFARQSYVGTGFVIPCTAITLYFFARALELGKPRDYAILGTVLAFDLMAHIIIHFYIIYLILVLVLIFLSRRKLIFLKQKWAWLFALGIFALWYLPMFIHFQLHENQMFLIDTGLFKTYNVWNGHGTFPWQFLFNDLQMFTVRTNSSQMAFLPYLSPWEGIFLICGAAWCLWQFLEPAFFLIFIGFLGGILPDVITGGATNPHRAIAALPFVFVFIGLGIDRLEKVIAAPLGKINGEKLGNLFLLTFLFLSIIWHYDVIFNQFAKNKFVYANESEDLYGNITAQHLKGWDTYDTNLSVNYQPQLGFYYLPQDMGNRISWHLPDIPLPLKTVPAKGTLILLDDDSGRAYADWMSYYYPDSLEKVIYNSFGDVKFRLWEITPDQIQKALKENKPFPNTGLTLSWYDPAGHQLGKWHIPVLSTAVLKSQWFQELLGKAPFPWPKVAYFMITGSLGNTDGKKLYLETTGKVTGTIHQTKVQINATGYPLQQKLDSPPKGWVSIKLRYVPKESDFRLDLFQRDITGWDTVPANELKTAGLP